MQSFASLAPVAPDFPALARSTDALLAGLNSASSVAAALEPLRDWDRLRTSVQDYDAWINLRFSQDTADSEIVAAKQAWDAAEPRWTELEVSVKRAALAHPLRAELETAIGSQAFALWSSEVLAFAPELKPGLAEESRLVSEYTAALAGAQIPFRGETENLSTLQRFRQSPDRELRHAAERAYWGWFQEHGTLLDRIFDDLVRVRTAMARELGRADFVEMGYDRMCRVDYSRADVERFRAQVRSEVVPLCEQLIQRQSGRLGIEPLMAWDEFVQDPAGNPAPRGDADWQVERAREMFEALGPEFERFFGALTDGGFTDLVSRKAGGGFCTSFPSIGMPFIFSNFNGTKGDVEVLTHEVGHAFQNWSSAELWPIDYHWPTFESAEIHSMALEFLTWPEMERFFGDEADRFRDVHLTESLVFLPYGTAVDHFQHELYAQPQLDPAARHALWSEMERTYLPWRRWGDLERPAAGGRWQAQAHIYASPFDYIDYVLAQTVALQFWSLSESDRGEALERYQALCRLGGSQPFQALVRSAGLASPFAEGSLTAVLERARATLAV